jgi:hypothetical protein
MIADQLAQALHGLIEQTARCFALTESGERQKVTAMDAARAALAAYDAALSAAPEADTILRELRKRLINLGAAILAQRHWGEPIPRISAEKQDDALADLGLEARKIADALSAWADAQKAPQPRTAEPAPTETDWVMAPRKPTWEMGDHALLQTAIDDHASRGSYNDAVYEAMIEAIPKRQQALENMAENARALGLNYDDAAEPAPAPAAKPRTAEPTTDQIQAAIDHPMSRMWGGAEPAPAPADEPPPLPEPVDYGYRDEGGTWVQQHGYTADQMRERDDYWIAKLQAERGKP